MKIKKIFKMALSSIWSNKVRSFLTMLGIIIGISSVIILVSIGEGTKKEVQSQIEGLGTNLITTNIVGKKSKALTLEDIESLKNKASIKYVAPVSTQNQINVKAGTKALETTIESTTKEYSNVSKTNVSKGRFLNERDIENRYYNAVIGQDTAIELFGNINVIGETININGMNFSIVGLLESKGSNMGVSSDDKIIIPLSVYQRVFKDTDIKSFLVEAYSKEKVEEAMGYLQLMLNKKYNNDTDSYKIFDQTSLLNAANESTSSMTTMLTGVAAISLIVGGIGIMNIMLVSVIERTREIGIRKAIGAKRKTILIQFLIESSCISFLGGIIGVSLAFLTCYVLKSGFNTPIVMSLSSVIVAVIFSIVVGIVFGMYPANKASKLNPIEALRVE
ncbi:ABC transporter permease [Clostridium oceanicum]|uniref:ABC transporter permease n=1 Tax=Clostridium oceanicum TaxID=1543 RepID=A0ABP3UQD1_9CLOT